MQGDKAEGFTVGLWNPVGGCLHFKSEPVAVACKNPTVQGRKLRDPAGHIVLKTKRLMRSSRLTQETVPAAQHNARANLWLPQPTF